MGDSFGKNFSGTGPYNEVMQASNGFIDAFKNASIRAAAGTAAPIAGFNKVARMMVDSNGRKALIELSRLPPGSRRANDLAGLPGRDGDGRKRQVAGDRHCRRPTRGRCASGDAVGRHRNGGDQCDRHRDIWRDLRVQLPPA